MPVKVTSWGNWTTCDSIRPVKNFAFALFLIFLPACVGGTLGNHDSIEEYPLRGASDAESKKLKRCLKAAYHFQEARKKKSGTYYKRPSDMPVDDYCQGLLLGQNKTETGYEIMAQLHENENTVRWTINQDGVIEEHLDPEYNDDLEF